MSARSVISFDNFVNFTPFLQIYKLTIDQQIRADGSDLRTRRELREVVDEVIILLNTRC